MPGKNDDLIATRPPQSVARTAFATLDELRRASSRPDAGRDAHALPAGFRLNEFEIVRKIGDGGFSVVYLAWDHSLERQVALKEYMPASIATRTEVTQIAPRSQQDRETFEAGLKSFVNEGRLLAQFDLPALVKVYRFWQANGTAYMVMPFYEGRTLREVVRAMPTPPDESWLVDAVLPLTEVLDVMHAARCYHRDIAPDNILLLDGSNAPLLLDFGAARRVVGDLTQALTVVLKPGYAPIEQYGDSPDMTQGPWTDVYALAAVLYWAISGKPPAVPITRIVKDAMTPAVEIGRGRYGVSFLQAIDRALVLRPDGRTRTVAAFRADLLRDRDGARQPPAAPPATPSGDDRSDATRVFVPKRLRSASTTSTTTAVDRTPRRRAFVATAVAGIVLAAIAAIWFFGVPKPSPQAPSATVERPPTAPAEAPPRAASATAPIVSPPRDASPTAPVEAPPREAPVAAPVVPPVTSVASAVAALVAGRDASIAVDVAPDRAPFVAGAARQTIDVHGATGGFVYLFAAGDGGRLALLGADAPTAAPAARVDRSFDVGRWTSTPSATGRWQVFAVVSRSPRTFPEPGWRDRDGVRQRTIGETLPATSPWGRPACPRADDGCSPAYGVASTWIAIEAAPKPQPPEPAAPPSTQHARPADVRTDAPKTATRARQAECAKAMERIAVGDSSAELLDKCR